MTGTSHPSDMISELRRIARSRKAPLTWLARRTGIPYRSLQNYFTKGNRLPAEHLLAICDALDITADYLRSKKFAVPAHDLRDALVAVLGPIIDQIDFNDDMRITLREQPRIGDAGRSRTVAGVLATLVTGAYDNIRERRLAEPIDQEEE